MKVKIWFIHKGPPPDYFACNWAGEKVSRIRESEFVFFLVCEMLSPREDKEEKDPLVLCWLSENTQVEWMESLKISNIVLKFRVHCCSDSATIIV